MHVLVLGGTGAIGLLIIRDLLLAQHTVVIFARSPQKLPDDITSNSNVTVVKGELTDATAIAGALKGVHAVVSALGKGPQLGSVLCRNTQGLFLTMFIALIV